MERKWASYLRAQMDLASILRAEEILVGEIADLDDRDGRMDAWGAYKEIVGTGTVASAAADVSNKLEGELALHS